MAIFRRLEKGEGTSHDSMGLVLRRAGLRAVERKVGRKDGDLNLQGRDNRVRCVRCVRLQVQSQSSDESEFGSEMMSECIWWIAWV